MADISVARSDGFHVLAAWCQGFSRWWLSELRETVPSDWLSWVDGDAMPRLLIWRDRDLVVCRLASAAGPIETRLPLHRFGVAAIKDWLAECGLRRQQVIVGPVIGRDLFFLRNLSVPKAALAALPKILDQEVLRRTPLQLSDIWHAAIPAADKTTDVLAMCHWIIRKDRAEAAIAELGLTAGDVDFLAASDANGELLPVIHFRATNHEDPPWARRAVKLLAMAGLGVVMCGLVAFEWSQANVATGIEASLVAAREGAQGGRGGLNQTARLFAMKADVGILEIWDELSRVLPDHTFLTETRIADGRVTLSGFSANAARLVRIIDQSPLFAGATLAAAITPDATEHKDRFSISLKVRGGRTVRPSGTAQGPTS
ncbi:MAG: hypothetical protein JWP51_4597 [Bradyrhizobium sp.]|nr:hypothetical protein [Bradyrhizobium sp.]